MSLALHCGAKIRTKDQIKWSITPEATQTWHPTPHIDIVNMLEKKLPEHGFEITEMALSLNGKGTRMFGMMNLATQNPDYSPVVGFRNAHDKMFSQGIICGSSVFVCDNLAFSSEINFRRRHTLNIERDFPGIIDEALSKLGGAQDFQANRINSYKKFDLDDCMAHHILVLAMKKWIFSPSKILKIVKEWSCPRHDAFEPRTLWSLFNCVTEVLKGGNIWVRAASTQALHQLFDAMVEERYKIHGENGENEQPSEAHIAARLALLATI